MQKLNDFEGRIGEAEKLLTHGICIVRLKRTFTYFYFDLYENSVYVQPPSFKNEIGGHGQANTKIFDTLFQLFQGKPRDLPLRLDK